MAKGRGGFIGQDGLNAPDSPTGVSASAGDAQATVSFTAPTDVGGSAITGYNVQSNDGSGTYRSPFDLSVASYDSKSFDVSSQDTLSLGLAFSADGTKMYMCGANNDTIYQYTLSTAWDVSTASYASKSLSVASQDTVPRGILLNADGTSIYVCGDINAAIFQYDMTTAYDLSTASYASKSLSVSSEEPGPAGIAFNNDGTKIYVIGYSNDNVRQYALSTAYDLSTGSYESKTLDVSSQDSSPRSLFFNSDGTKLFVNGNANDTMYRYSLSSAYDVSTGSYDNVSFLYSAQADDANAVTFKPDGSKMYVCNFGSDQVVYQYSTQVTDYPTASPVTITGLTNGTSYTFNVWAINAFGFSAPSDASTGVTPDAPAYAFFFQGNASTNVDQVNMSSESNTIDFGDLTTTAVLPSAVCTATRLVVSGPTDTNTTMEYWSTSTGGTGATFGDLLTARYGRMAANNTTRGIFAGGYVGGAKDDIEYITIASTGNATDFGDLTEQKYRGFGTICSATRGVFSSGYTNGTSFNDSNVIEYITIASTGNATDFGDDTIARHGGAAASNSTRGVIAGGAVGGSGSNVISYITIASTGNATDFGDLSATGQNIGGAANSTKAFFCSSIFGGSGFVKYVTISSTGNSSDWGNGIASQYGISVDHGGLQ